MSLQKVGLYVAAITGIGVMVGCVSAPAVIDSGPGQVQIRSIQTRAFDTGNREQVIRTVMATLQDLGFVIEKADSILGSVTATKLSGYDLRMTVTVRMRGEQQVLVRANAQYGDKPVTEPKPYQDFFTALEKSLFLAAHAAD